MARAIKHIRAGLFHVEALGTAPEQGPGRRRSGPCLPTSPAQQFYNDKCSWKECRLSLAANFARGDWVVTPTYDDAHLPPDRQEADKCLQKFIRRLRAARRKRGEALRYIYATEGLHGEEADKSYKAGAPAGAQRSGSGGERRSKGANAVFAEGGNEDERNLLRREDRRLHHHMVLNGTGPGDWEEIRSLWQGGGYVRIEPVDVHYYKELAKYLTKEAREFGRAKPGERSWRGSRNLLKYQVEYIEIPSDSVTLSAPPGAVDYVQFTEKNPYGYADCVVAEYLLFEDTAVPRYSYTEGRKKQLPNNF